MDVWTVNRFPRTLFFEIPTDLSNILFSDYSKSESFWGRQKYKWIEFVGLDCLGFIVFILFWLEGQWLDDQVPVTIYNVPDLNLQARSEMILHLTPPKQHQSRATIAPTPPIPISDSITRYDS